MLRSIFTICFFAFFLNSYAQRGSNGLELAVEAGFPAGNFSSYKAGVGFLGRGLLGVGERAQLTFTTGYSFFSQKQTPPNTTVKMSVIPLLLGYKYNVSLLYLHPQLGLGIYSGKTKTTINNMQTKTKTSDGGFTMAIGGGVKLGRADLGVRYQAGFPGGGTVGYFGFHAGYIF